MENLFVQEVIWIFQMKMEQYLLKIMVPIAMPTLITITILKLMDIEVPNEMTGESLIS